MHACNENGNELVSTELESISADTEQLGDPLITQPPASRFTRVII